MHEKVENGADAVLLVIPSYCLSRSWFSITSSSTSIVVVEAGQSRGEKGFALKSESDGIWLCHDNAAGGCDGGAQDRLHVRGSTATAA